MMSYRFVSRPVEMVPKEHCLNDIRVSARMNSNRIYKNKLGKITTYKYYNGRMGKYVQSTVFVS